MCIGSFSLHSKWIGLSKRYPNSSVLRRDVESDRLIGNHGYIRNLRRFGSPVKLVKCYLWVSGSHPSQCTTVNLNAFNDFFIKNNSLSL